MTKEAPTGPIWIAESVTTKTYGISPYLRQHAIRELKAHGLITYRRNFIKKPFGMQSSRTELALNLDRLALAPGFRT